MTREEIDVLWQQAQTTAVKAGEMFTRYEFANLILEKAALKCEALSLGVPSDDTDKDAIEVCAEAIRSMKV